MDQLPDATIVTNGVQRDKGRCRTLRLWLYSPYIPVPRAIRIAPIRLSRLL